MSTSLAPTSQTKKELREDLVAHFAGDLSSHDPEIAASACGQLVVRQLDVDATYLLNERGNIVASHGSAGQISSSVLGRLAGHSRELKGAKAVLLVNDNLGAPAWYTSRSDAQQSFARASENGLGGKLRDDLRAVANGKRVQLIFFTIARAGKIVGYGLTVSSDRYFDAEQLPALGETTRSLSDHIARTVERINLQQNSLTHSINRSYESLRRYTTKSALARLGGIAAGLAVILLVPFPFSLSGKGVYEPKKRTVQHSCTLGGGKATIVQLNSALKPGQWVEAGTWLATLDSAELAAEENRNSELIQQLLGEQASLAAKRRRGGDGEARSAKQEIDAQLHGVETQLVEARSYRDSLTQFRSGLQLKAPTSGILLEPVKLENLLRTTYDAGAPIFLIGDTSEYEVMIEITEPKYRLIKREPGERSVTWYIEPGVEFHGTVTRMHELPAKSAVGTKTFRLVVSVSPEAFERYKGQVDLSVVAKVDCGHRSLVSKFGGWRFLEWLQEFKFEYWGPGFLPQ